MAAYKQPFFCLRYNSLSIFNNNIHKDNNI